MVVNSQTGAAIGGMGANHFRPWVFPFYAPSGRTVVQAFPHAHPWHNGIFVGHQLVESGGRAGNFWAVPPIRCEGDAIFDHVGRIEMDGEMTASPIPNGMEFHMECQWLDENGTPLLSESRTVRLFEDEDANFCDVVSTRHASHGALVFPKIKLGGLGLRAEPLLAPDAGAVVIADGGRRGDSSIVHELDSTFVAYERDLPFSQSGPLGVCLMIRDANRGGPWFIRDFGLALYNPTFEKKVEVPAGGSWTLSLRVAGYDGPLTDERVSRWRDI
jgi:hypothetical protein